MSRPPVQRTAVLWGWLRSVAVAAGLLSLLVGLGLQSYLDGRGTVGLDGPGIGLAAPDGGVRPLGAGDALLPGTRVLDGPAAGAMATQQRHWLAAGRVPAAGLPGDLVSSALLDLQALSRPYGVAVAGWSPSWRYVWPRDTAFVVSAMARTGHRPEARAGLGFLQRVQATDGLFEARYAPDGSPVPDRRGVQLDGTGWALWALGQAAGEVAEDGERRALLGAHRVLLDRSTDAAVRLISARTGLPPASPDYWEVPESQPTLATCAVLLAGLRTAVDLYTELGLADRAQLAASAADRLERATLATFGADGFPRRPGGGPGSVDLGVSFLLAPFAGVGSPAARRAWQAAPRQLRRPAGGLAPGGSWPRDGISWTPTVATYAVTAGCLDPGAARHWLQWLAEHRTATGALPEKVRADGSPAATAPLAWTAAAVVIAADEVERGCRDR